MFKKATVSSQNKLGKNDVKRLKKDVTLLMPALSEADVDTLLPTKCAGRRVARVAAARPHRASPRTPLPLCTSAPRRDAARC